MTISGSILGKVVGKNDFTLYTFYQIYDQLKSISKTIKNLQMTKKSGVFP
jgi:hypothetical protein